MRLFKKITCQSCSRSFGSEEERMQHQQTVHDKDSPYDCKVCNQNFSNMQDMRAHLQKFHSYKKDRTQSA
ncbi:MAG: C2H2-type zinc finger protein [Candidatus Nitrosotenuis sp.]|uniref:C2H2-type zinc finger protein n=1 Tax=Candidatus Nitrosotenuis cloacae TaxID=1603555 RepID=UPI0022809682|nr:C2H2-type zinc finger protein [Candidatus Nitrosotenuis cloacae]MDC8437775.1 C2H2-type zinc finger protein [Candidatus Nitrosotenuis sp.]